SGNVAAKGGAIRPAASEQGPGLGGESPMLAVLEGVEDQDTHKLTHGVASGVVARFKLTHRKCERVFHRNGEPVIDFVVLHRMGGVLRKGNAANDRSGWNFPRPRSSGSTASPRAVAVPAKAAALGCDRESTLSPFLPEISARQKPLSSEC